MNQVHNEFRPICSLCGTYFGVDFPKYPLCDECNSSPRQRAITLALLKHFNIREKCLLNVRPNKSRTGIGISDTYYLAGLLSWKFSYVNTFYHKFPRVDIDNPPSDLEGYCDFIVCSEVLEHTMPPIKRSLDGLCQMLKPGGLLILTVPIFKTVDGVEEIYGSIKSYQVNKTEFGHGVTIFTNDGTEYEATEPRFHGGPGNTLEVRKFSREGLLLHAENSGFSLIDELSGNDDYAVPQDIGPIFVFKRI